MLVLLNLFNKIKIKINSGAYIISSIRTISIFSVKSFITLSPIISIVNSFIT